MVNQMNGASPATIVCSVPAKTMLMTTYVYFEEPTKIGDTHTGHSTCVILNDVVSVNVIKNDISVCGEDLPKSTIRLNHLMIGSIEDQNSSHSLFLPSGLLTQMEWTN